MEFEDLRLMATGFQPAKLLLVALDAGVFDLLAHGPRTGAEVAQSFGLDSRATEIALNALVGLGLLVKEEDRYRNAEGAGRFLSRGSPEYRGEILRHIHNTWEDWAALAQTWRDGKPEGTRRARQMPSTPEGTRHFILGMEDMTRDVAPRLADRLPLAGRSRLLDLGGGPGNYALAFATRWPDLRVVHFDLPATSAIAREFAAGKPGSDRVEFREGDFLSSELGEGYDFVWASQIIHMLGEAEVQTLLSRVAQTLGPGGVLAIHDHFLDAGGTHPPSASLFGVHMLAVTERGRTFTFEEVEDWLRAAGLEPGERVEYGGPARILLAGKAQAG